MKIKKALVFGETKGLDKNFLQSHSKPIQVSRQEKQFTLEFNEPQPKQPRILGIIACFDCKRQAELDGYRFRLVPVCACCRTEREVEIVNNRFERRQKR